MDPESYNTLYIFTHKFIIKFLKLFITEFPKPESMSKSLEELQIGTCANTGLHHYPCLCGSGHLGTVPSLSRACDV